MDCVPILLYFYIKIFLFESTSTNVVMSLILNSICSLLKYRKVTDFYILTLYSADVLWPYNHFWSKEVSPPIFLDYLCRWLCHQQTKTVLLFSFSINICFISFSWLTALAKISNILFKSSKRMSLHCTWS